jgi:hypothetical protein
MRAWATVRTGYPTPTRCSRQRSAQSVIRHPSCERSSRQHRRAHSLRTVNVLITGMSGTGKSAVVGELRRGGYKAYDADDHGFSEPRSQVARVAVPIVVTPVELHLVLTGNSATDSNDRAAMSQCPRSAHRSVFANVFRLQPKLLGFFRQLRSQLPRDAKGSCNLGYRRTSLDT